MPAAPLQSPYVWFVTLPAAIAGDGLDRCLAVLDDDERARAAAFKVEPARQQFVVAHALLRMLLSKFRPVPASEWRFVRGEHGKPLLTTPGDAEPLHFNLSHTNGAVVATVSTDGDIGVDVERIDPAIEITSFGSCLSASELSTLNGLPSTARSQRFYELWAAKEAVAKAVGTGISSAMAGIEIVTHDNSTRSRSGDSRYDGWNVTRAILPGGQISAVATREPASIAFRLSTFDEWMLDPSWTV